MKKFTINKNEYQEIHLIDSGEYIVEIIGEGGEVKIVGAFDVKDNDRADIALTVIHKASHTKATTVLKGVADDQASVRFFGLIKIEPGYVDVQSFLEERVLLLSEHAKAEAIPQLEILSSDVECSHAASVSQIPPEQLFYIESRGIPKKEAESMIVAGFLDI